MTMVYHSFLAVLDELTLSLEDEIRKKVGEIIRACPGVSQPTIRRVLDELRLEGQIRCIQKGKDAEWEKS
jgi:hypothetical protein